MIAVKVVVGIEVQLRHRGPDVTVLQIGGPDVEQLRQQRHALLVVMVEVDAAKPVGRSEGVGVGGRRHVAHAGIGDAPNTHRTPPVF